MKEKFDEIKKLKDVNGYGMGENGITVIYMVRENKSTENRISEILRNVKHNVQVIGEITLHG